MKLLLDTHILLWTLADDVRLSEKARKLFENEENDLYYSIASIWEIQMKCLARPGQMDFTAEQVSHYCKESGFYKLPVNEAHIFYLKELNRIENASPHKDPFDRIMVCQAAVENMLFVTHDHLTAGYNEPCIYVV